ncbi:MAG: HAD-IC family P-type ATPase, partial [bacterium]|nr:HAD-IC family P-type ATPase [bacterium]
MQNKRGLTEKEAKKRLKNHGENKLPSKPPTSDITIFFRQLTSPLIYILLIASGITFFLKDFTDTAVIMVAVVINTALGYYQERKAERALESLRSFLRPTATVLRGGLRLEIPIEEIVPGDVVILAAGERVPADGELIEVHSLTINEAILTGESVPVQKVMTGRSNTASLVFMGTTVLSGRGLVKIKETGVNTQIGKIAVQLRDEKEAQTPLQLKLAKLAKFLAVAVVIIAALIFIIGVLTGKDPLEMFTIGVAVAVAAIPEGLMVSLTVILAIGMQRIFKRKALVRKLVAAETLGSVTIVASDKTGTLTEGKMSVSRTDFTDTKTAHCAMHYANNQEDPLEIAINEYLLHIKGLAFNMEKIDELPFDSDLKYQCALVKGENQNTLYLSGAPEIVLELCNIDNKEKDKWLKKIEEWGEQSLRIVGLACKTHSRNVIHIPGMGIVSCQWLGLVGIEDPVRVGVVETIEAMGRSGVRLKIITGDYLPTARAIWSNIKAESSYLKENYKLDL